MPLAVPTGLSREELYLRYRVEKGAVERWGEGWQDRDSGPERMARIQLELTPIEGERFSSYFLILTSIMDFLRAESIPYTVRGSAGGSLVLYLLGVTEFDPMEWDLMFERFINPERISFPDVDVDVSQRHRPRVLQFIRDEYENDDVKVLQIAAFARAGGRRTIENMVAAKRFQGDDQADAIGTILKQCLPEGNITGGQKVPKELEHWLKTGHGDKDKFRATAEAAGWMKDLESIDGQFTHLAKHAAGVVILSDRDLHDMPRAALTDSKTKEQSITTGYDMYDLDELGYLKLDLLGLRTLDVIVDAHQFAGGTGNMRDLMGIWLEHRDDPKPYQMLCDADTLGVFQMETEGYRRTLRAFEPSCFEHIVQLNALYRPGAIDFKRAKDGKNMVEVFIDRLHGREDADYPIGAIESILRKTHGIILYQEQAMKIAQAIAGFTGGQADSLRKAIGKKKQKEMDELKPLFLAGCAANKISPANAGEVWDNIAAASRYSWNLSHSVEYGIITWLTLWFKFNHPAAFYTALLNSYEGDKDRMAGTLAEARQKVKIRPPDVNIAKDDFVVDEGEIVFGFNGIKGMGSAYRGGILMDRAINGDFTGFEEMALRLPSLPISIKTALVQCGAFDSLESRSYLLAKTTKPGKGSECEDCKGSGLIDVDTGKAAAEGTGHCGTGFSVDKCLVCGGEGSIPKEWTIAEAMNHNRTLKKPRPIPPPWECLSVPTPTELSAGENDVIGFYITEAPLEYLAHALARCPKGNHHGGEIEAIYKKTDKRGEEYASMTLLDPALQRQRVIVFASVYRKWRTFLTKGKQLIVRGKKDGETVLADSFFEPDDVRHFNKMRASKEGEPGPLEKWEGTIDTVRELESAGYTVSFL